MISPAVSVDADVRARIGLQSRLNGTGAPAGAGGAQLPLGCGAGREGNGKFPNPQSPASPAPTSCTKSRRDSVWLGMGMDASSSGRVAMSTAVFSLLVSASYYYTSLGVGCVEAVYKLDRGSVDRLQLAAPGRLVKTFQVGLVVR